jgi:hypothetical protein
VHKDDSEKELGGISAPDISTLRHFRSYPSPRLLRPGLRLLESDSPIRRHRELAMSEFVQAPGAKLMMISSNMGKDKGRSRGVPPTSSIHSGIRVASSPIFSLMLSLRRRSTALWLSRRRRRFSFAIIALRKVPRLLYCMRHENPNRTTHCLAAASCAGSAPISLGLIPPAPGVP